MSEWVTTSSLVDDPHAKDRNESIQKASSSSIFKHLTFKNENHLILPYQQDDHHPIF